MFNPFKPKQKPSPSVIASLGKPSRGNLEKITLQLSGLHCTSCATNIDLTLEDLPSVQSSTNYAKQETTISYDPNQTTLDQIHFAIRDLGYSIL